MRVSPVSATPRHENPASSLSPLKSSIRPPSSSSNVVVRTHREASKTPLIRNRRHAHKVRTGCFTCKHRRVKCDEGKPQCQRCIKSGTICKGYEASQKPVLKTDRTHRAPIKILPKLIMTANPPMNAIRLGVGFQNELDAQYFHVYLGEAAEQISGLFSNSLWERLIPQTSETEPFIRHAVIAIGALEKQRRSQYQPRPMGVSYPADDYQYALKQYDISLRCMRHAIACGKQDLQKALIASLLVFCVESMLGNQAAAALHAERGLMLLRPWKVGNQSYGKKSRIENVSREHISEGDLLETFDSLDLQVLLFIDNRNYEVRQRTIVGLNLMIEAMPLKFETLKEARRFWQLIFNRNCHFSQSIKSMGVKGIQKEMQEQGWEGSANFSKGEILFSTEAGGPSPLKKEQLRYQNDIARWISASNPVFRQIGNGTNEQEKARAALLQVHNSVSRVMLAGSFIQSEMEYDVYRPEYTTIITNCDAVLRYNFSCDQWSAPRFHFDIGIVPALFLVGSRCRFDVLREKAIAMLFSANIREGIWDSLAVAHIARWLRSIELGDLTEGEMIPEEKRAFLSAISLDLFQRKVMVIASQGLKSSLLERTSLVTW